MLASVLPPVVVIVAVAALVHFVFEPWYLNYDTRYALDWARDFVHGLTPDFEAPFAPTPHPGWNAIAVLALPFGGSADDAMVAVTALSFGAVVWLVYRIGLELFNRWVGIVAALIVVTRAAMLRDVVLAYLDVSFGALILAAVLLEIRRPRRGAAVLGVLVLAGLLRPEAWVLGALYLAYLWRGLEARERARYAGLVLLAPVIWIVADAIITGDPLHSLHGTAALAEENDRHRSLGDVPYWTLQYLGFTLRLPVLIGVLVGLAFAWRRGVRRAHIPLVVAGLLILGFAASPIFGLPLIGRYMRTPSMLLALFYGAACFGWLSMAPSKERTRWAMAGIVCLALSVAWIPSTIERLDGLRGRRDRESRFYGSLRNLAQSPAFDRAFAKCPDVVTSDHRPVPYLRWWLEGDPGTVGTLEDRTSPLRGIYVTPKPSLLMRVSYGNELPKAKLPRGYELLGANRHWKVGTTAACAP
jgi:MFS family permease